MGMVLVSRQAWELAFLPDSQGNGADITTETQWIVDNRSSMNCKAVCHCGDLVGDPTGSWTNPNNAFAVLDSAAIPYAISPGNHDLSGTFPNNGTYFGTYFGANKRTPAFNSRAYWAGSYNDDCLGSCVLFSAGGTDFILLASMDQQNDGDAFDDWAAGKLSDYSSRKAIIVTHVWLKPDGTPWIPYLSSHFWQTTVIPNSNVFLILSGHYVTTYGGGYEAHATTDISGRKVHQILANYQEDEDDCQFLRLLFTLPTKEIRVRTFNPSSGQYVSGPNKDYLLDISGVI